MWGGRNWRRVAPHPQLLRCRQLASAATVALWWRPDVSHPADEGDFGMEDQIVAKLRRLLGEPITDERLVVYLLVEVRKLMDRKQIQSDTLRLCCNWVVHVELSGEVARRIVKHVDALYPRLANGQLTDEDKSSLRAFFLMSKFRQELEHLLIGEGLRRFEDGEWNGFLACFLNVIEDCPLTCDAPGLANVDKVVLIREMGGERAPAPDAPAIVWALYRRNQHIFMLGANFEKSNRALAELN
jgi:hypothetical protein